MKRVFISIPYTHDDKYIVQERVDKAERYFLHLQKNGYCPVSPVVVGHNLVKKYGTSGLFSHWKEYCISELTSCSTIDILTVNGWDTSVGVKEEIEEAVKQGKEVRYIPI